MSVQNLCSLYCIDGVDTLFEETVWIVSLSEPTKEIKPREMYTRGARDEDFYFINIGVFL